MYQFFGIFKINFFYFSILIIASTKQELRVKVDVLLHLLEKLGFSVNLEKSHLVPAQSFDYLGIHWNTDKWSVQLIEKRKVKIKESATELLTCPVVSCRAVSRFIGRIQSADGIYPLARGRIRNIQWDFLSACTTVADYDSFMCLSDLSIDELFFWQSADLSRSLPISVKSASSTLYTDASDEGIGIYYMGHTVHEKFPTWLINEHINLKELYAVDRAVEIFGNKLKCSTVTLRIDNNTALAAIKKQGSTRNWNICQLAVRIAKNCEKICLNLIPIRISSQENLLADSASRNKNIADWQLHPTLVRRVFQKFGVPDIDLFATAMSAQVPAYFTWNLGDEYARGVDALALDLDWSIYNLPYAFPPFSLIPLVLEKVMNQKVPIMILICPFWPSKTFFPVLKKLSMNMYRIPFRPNMITDLQSGEIPPNVRKLRLVACLISGRFLTNQEGGAKILMDLPGTSLQPHGGQVRKGSTHINGEDGTATVEENLYNLLPLL